MKKKQRSKSLFLKYAIQKAGSMFINLRKDVVLDFKLSTNDLAVYIAIMADTSAYGEYREVSAFSIFTITNITDKHLNRATDKLSKAGYIKTQKRKGFVTKYAIEKIEKQDNLSYIPISTIGINHILSVDKKSFVEKLRVLFLLNGSEQLPRYSDCKSIGISFYKYGFLKTMFSKILAFEKYDFSNYEEQELEYDTLEALNNCSSIKCYESLYITLPLLKTPLKDTVSLKDFIASIDEVNNSQ